MNSEPVIGIDLGTGFSCVGIWENGGVTILTNQVGFRTTPSVVTFVENPDGSIERLIGNSAKDSIVGTKIYTVKRLIGRRWNESATQEFLKNLSFTVKESHDRPQIVVTHPSGKVEKFSPEEISAMVLTNLKKIAEDYTGKKISKAVITVPSNFNEQQKSATKDAAAIAGIEVMRLITEPTAAAMAYGLDKVKEGDPERIIVVADFGSGTLDVSIMCMDDGVYEMKSSSGETNLGGEDFDNSIVDYCLDFFKNKNRIDLRQMKKNTPTSQSIVKAFNKLKREAERVKISLSSQKQVPIQIESLYEGIDLNTSITRARFEELNANLFERSIKCVEKAMADSGYSKSQITDVVIVGGSSRIPKFQELLSRTFGGKELCKSINPDEAIATGAAMYAGVLGGKNKGETGNILLLDIIPISLGVSVGSEGIMGKIVERNTTIPCKKTQTFRTMGRGQPAALIEIYEGERSQARANRKLGEFLLEGLDGPGSEKIPQAGGASKVEISFSIDANALLEVIAKSGSIEKKLKINDRSRLTQEEIDEMINTAARYEEEDKKFLARAEARGRLDSLCSSFGEDESRASLRNEIRQWIDSNPNASTEELNEAYDTFSKKASSQESSGGSAPVVEEVD